MLRKLFNRRKHPRFVVEPKTYIVFGANTSGEKKMQIIDISEGGCGFVYHGDEKDLNEMCLASLTKDNVPPVEQVKVATASDQPASGPYRRRGVEFKWLGLFDKTKLKKFIEKVSLSKT